MAKKKSKNKSSKPKSTKRKSSKPKSSKRKSSKRKSSKNKRNKNKNKSGKKKSMKQSKTDRKFNNTLPIDKTTMKIMSTLIPVLLVTFIIGLSFAKGFDNGKVFDMSIVHFLVTHPAFIFVALFLIIATMYFTYASKMEHWLYYCMGSGGSAPWFIGLFTFIIMIDILIGINFGVGLIQKVIAIPLALLAFAMSPITSILGYLIYLVFTLLNLRMSGAFFIVYLYIHSFLGRAFYANGGITGGYDEIDKIIMESIKNVGKECESNGSIEQFVRIMLTNVYNNMYLVLFVMILLSGIFTYYKKMKSAAKSGFIFINTIILVGTVLYKVLYGLYNKRGDKSSSSDYDMPPTL
jgi:hypothetical protein